MVDAGPPGARVGPYVRNARVARGVGLRALAGQIGVSPATLSQIEHGRTRLTVERLDTIAAALGIPAADILEGRTRSIAPSRASRPDPHGSWRIYEPLDLGPVLDAARAEFLEVGYHAATMRRIAARCGMAVSGLYHHHSGKQQMLRALVEYAMTDLDRRAVAARAEGADPVSRFCLLVENLALYHTHRSELAFIGDSEMRSFTDANRRHVAIMRTRQQRRVDHEVEAATAAGRFRHDHPREAARAVVTMCTSLAAWYRHSGRYGPEEIARQYVGFGIDLMTGTSAPFPAPGTTGPRDP
ncbi:TetR family transcriptional regulator [Pseudonocardia nematodicida]|uniref:TetR family transcriptional regulator n=1 Tax=Pseudonocardia nematodicida TaxID=1206997 RepID=A0ABV1KDY3_9PSEU